MEKQGKGINWKFATLVHSIEHNLVRYSNFNTIQKVNFKIILYFLVSALVQADQRDNSFLLVKTYSKRLRKPSVLAV